VLDPKGEVTKLSAPPKLWDALWKCRGPVVCACDIVGTVKVGDASLQEATSLTVDALTDIGNDIHTLAVNRCQQNSLKALFPAGAYRDAINAAVSAKKDWIDGTITEQALNDIVAVARALPYKPGQGPVLDSCKTNVSAAGFGAAWVTSFLGDHAAIEPWLESVATTALGV
jgi:hypothetical protein